MKKMIIISSLTASLLLPNAGLYAKDNKTEESIGFGSGLIVGAVAGGPIGAILGAAAGAWLGDKVNESEKVPNLSNQLAEHKVQQQAIKQAYSILSKSHDQLQLDLQQQQVFQAKVSQSKQLISGIQLDLMFRSNSSTLEPLAYQKLTPVILMLEHFPELQLELTGHGDVVGTQAKNKVVASKRSQAVKAQLLAAGIAPERVNIKVAGKADAKADFHDLEGRALDRRVRLRFMQQPQAQTLASK